jgi:hypothetical protein
MEINLKNIEEIIFFDKQVQHLLPEFRHLFDQWVLAYRNSGLKPLAKSSVFELMNNLDDSHIKKLENYFLILKQLRKYLKIFQITTVNFSFAGNQLKKTFW